LDLTDKTEKHVRLSPRGCWTGSCQQDVSSGSIRDVVAPRIQESVWSKSWRKRRYKDSANAEQPMECDWIN